MATFPTLEDVGHADELYDEILERVYELNRIFEKCGGQIAESYRRGAGAKLLIALTDDHEYLAHEPTVRDFIDKMAGLAEPSGFEGEGR